MQTHPHTSKAVIALFVSGAIASLHAGSLGVGVGATAGITGGAVGLGAVHAGGATGFGGAHVGVGAASVGAAHANGAAGLSAGAADGMNAMVGSAGFVSVPQTIVDVDSFETIGMRQARLAETHGGAVVATTPAAANANEHSAVAALNVTSADQIRATAIDHRAQLASDIDAGLKAHAKALAKAKADAKTLNAEEQAQFKASLKESSAREKVVKSDLKKVRKAAADGWVDARAKLAADYDAYVQATEHAQAIASASTASASHTTKGAVTATSEVAAHGSTRAATATTTAMAKAAAADQANLKSENASTTAATHAAAAAAMKKPAVNARGDVDAASTANAANRGATTDIADATTASGSASAQPKL